MMDLLVKNAAVILPDSILDNMCVSVKDGRIASVEAGCEFLPGEYRDVIDAAGGFLAPGFIDLHIHGLLEYQFDNGREDVQSICSILPSYGVTGVLAAFLPRPFGEDTAYVRSISEHTYQGADVLGFFFEGPFIGISGAINPAALTEKTVERIRALKRASVPYSAVFAVSPELKNAGELIAAMTEGGIPAFITHTAADVKQTEAAVKAGAGHATHFYDVFPVPKETDPGVRPCGAVEAILADPGVSVDFILDGEHVDPAAVKMALACKGPDRVCLITDASAGAGLPPGVYSGIEGIEVRFAYEGAPARGTENSPFPNGLAGSGLTMDKAVRNAVKLLGVDIPLACRMASLNPAAVLGLANELGMIRSGYFASMVLLDRDLQVKASWVKGVRVF